MAAEAKAACPGAGSGLLPAGLDAWEATAARPRSGEGGGGSESSSAISPCSPPPGGPAGDGFRRGGGSCGNQRFGCLSNRQSGNFYNNKRKFQDRDGASESGHGDGMLPHPPGFSTGASASGAPLPVASKGPAGPLVCVIWTTSNLNARPHLFVICRQDGHVMAECSSRYLPR